MTNLWNHFNTNKDRAIDKHFSYFHAYEKHFAKFVNQSIVMLEIGVQNGGSAQMWRNYFGPFAKIVGIDINSKCKELEENNIFVRIGDQGDHAFLSKIIDEFGVPNIVLDDGSHRMKDINSTFDFLYPKMPPNSVYLVEDLHTAYWERFGGGLNKKDTFVERSKHLIDSLNANYAEGSIDFSEFSRTTSSITFYPSIICFEKNINNRGYGIKGEEASVWDPRDAR